MSTQTDKYLDQLQEIEPITVSLGVGVIAAVTSMVTVLVSAMSIRNSVRVNKKWTKRLNEILNTNDWKVHMVPDKVPNGFSAGGKNVFLTTGLVKLLSQREVEAVMLHEVYHNESKHLGKSIAYKFPFIFMIFYIASATAFVPGGIILAIIIVVLLRGVPQAAYAIAAGKRHEIKADEHAVKYGYGDELASALKKIENLHKSRAQRKDCGIICQANRKLEDIIDEHPPMAKRIENIIRKKRELNSVLKSGSFKKIKNFVMKELKK